MRQSEKAESIESIKAQLTTGILGSILDHTKLGPTTTESDIAQLCAEAQEMHAGSVCINPYYVAFVFKELEGSNIAICTVVGFPHGQNTTASKTYEAEEAIEKGAREIDLVVNNGLETGSSAYYQDIYAVAQAIKEGGALLKVIIETANLTQDHEAQVILASQTVKQVGIELSMPLFVKTSTGYAKSGANTQDVEFMRYAVGEYSTENRVGIKAAGGIRDLDTTLEMIYHAGGLQENGILYTPLRDVVRIGASAGISILSQFRDKQI